MPGKRLFGGSAMRILSRRHALPLVTAALALPFLKTPALAGTLYWDNTGTTWDVASSWSTLSNATTPDPASPPGVSDFAIFNITTVNSNIAPHINSNIAVMGIVYNSTGTCTIVNNATTQSLTLAGGNILVNAGAGAFSIHEQVPIIFTASNFITNNSNNLLTLNGSITGPYSVLTGGTGNITIGASPKGGLGADIVTLVKTGTGTLTLTSGNGALFTGNIIINAGTFLPVNAFNSTTPNTLLFGPDSTGTLTLQNLSQTVSNLATNASPGTPVVQNGSAIDNIFTVKSTANSTFAGTIKDGGTGKLTLAHSGTATLTLAGTNTFTGGLIIRDGTVKMGGPNALNDLDAVSFPAGSSGVLCLDGFSTYIGGLSTATNAGTPSVINGHSAHSAVLTIVLNGVNTFNGTLADGGPAPLSLTTGGSGTLILGGDNAFTGGLYLVSGLLQLKSTGALNPNFPNTVIFDSAGSATLALNGNSVTIGGLIATGVGILQNGATTSATLTLNDLANADHTFAGTLQNGSTGPLSLIKSDAGILLLKGTQTYTGSTTISQGTLTFGSTAFHSIGAVSGSGTLLINPQATLTTDGVILPTLINNGFHIVRPGGTNTIKVNTLTLAGATNAWAAQLDLLDNPLILQTASPADKSVKFPILQNQLASGKNGGTWNGMGITSSSVAADPTHLTLALADNADLHYTSFHGQQVNDNSLLVFQTLFGDATLDHKVDSFDLNVLAAHWQMNVPGSGITGSPLWSGGDFTGDNKVDAFDLNVLAANWQSSTPLEAALSLSFYPLPFSPLPSTPSPIPEPASLLLLLPALALCRRRTTGDFSPQ